MLEISQKLIENCVQDIAALSEENVNVANWVNSTLQKTNGQPNKEVFLIDSTEIRII